MSLDASTLEWTRRLPAVPDDHDAAALRVLRRHTSDPSDIRLLDSLLAEPNARAQKRDERGRLEARRDYLRAMNTPAGQAELERQRQVAISHLASTIAYENRQLQHEAIPRAEAALRSTWQERDAEERSELASVEAQLAALPAD